jgi:hypothetical protein
MGATCLECDHWWAWQTIFELFYGRPFEIVWLYSNGTTAMCTGSSLAGSIILPSS